jgi:hypothetical protein
MSPFLAVVGIVTVPAVATVAARWCARQFSTRGIERRLEGLCGQVVSWQAAHDHQVAGIDRRLRDVEASAARAENEARMVSVQLVDLSRSLLGRIEQVERRLASRRHPQGARPRTASTNSGAGLVAGAGR